DDGGGGGVRRHTRRHVPTHACLVEPPGLLGQCRVDRGITGAQSRNILAALMSRNHVISDLVKIKMLTVDQRGLRRAMSQDLGVDVGPGVDAHRRRFNEPYGSYG